MVPECRGCGFSIADLDRKLRQVPARVGFVNDFAGLLAAEDKAHLEERLSQLQQQLDGELVLTMVRSTKPVKPSEYVFWLFNRWQVGGNAHTGLIVLLTQAERRIECEVGYGWEPFIAEEESGNVLDKHVLPLMQTGKIAEALREGVEQFARIIVQAMPSERRTLEKPAAEGGEL
jgi:uncharacterized membrane protein YgcG